MLKTHRAGLIVSVGGQASLLRQLKKYKSVYIMLIPLVAYYLVFHYVPMYGMIIALKDYSVTSGITNSPWAGFKHFENFFNSYFFGRLIKNTLSINLLSLIFSFPAPILFAIFLNEVSNARFKKSIQTITYLPHFISLTVICSMILDFFSTRGLINSVITLLGGSAISFFNDAAWFQPVYIITDIWAGFGWGSVVYLAAISGINPELYEAATIDGANRWRQMRHVTIAGILPTITIMLIMKVGHMMSLGSQKILLLYNPNIYETSDVISTFVYRKGLLGGEYSYTSAVDLFSAVINLVLLIAVNRVCRRLSETSLW